MTLTFEPGPEKVKPNQRAERLSRMPFSSKVIVQTHTHIHCSTWTTKLVDTAATTYFVTTSTHGADQTEATATSPLVALAAAAKQTLSAKSGGK